jgi:hypothetical protein
MFASAPGSDEIKPAHYTLNNGFLHSPNDWLNIGNATVKMMRSLASDPESASKFGFAGDLIAEFPYYGDKNDGAGMAHTVRSTQEQQRRRAKLTASRHGHVTSKLDGERYDSRMRNDARADEDDDIYAVGGALGFDGFYHPAKQWRQVNLSAWRSSEDAHRWYRINTVHREVVRMHRNRAKSHKIDIPGRHSMKNMLDDKSWAESNLTEGYNSFSCTLTNLKISTEAGGYRTQVKCQKCGALAHEYTGGKARCNNCNATLSMPLF